jgi:hypothetical protein
MQATKFVLAIVLAASASPAFADMRVTDSTDSHFKRGDKVETIDAAKLEPGSFVTVLHGTKTQTFHGPAAAPVQIGGMRGIKLKSDK